MNELYAKRLVFDIEPRELVRLLRGHRKAKAGPFSWKLRHEGREVGLFLIIEKLDKDGFEGTVSTMLHRISGSDFFAQEGEPVATLHGTRVREGQTLVLMKCPDPMVTGWIFVNFTLGMEQLQKELAKPAPETAHPPADMRVESPSPGPALPAAAPEKPLPEPRAASAASGEEDLSAPPGRPGLDHDELLYRLAKAQEAEELKRKSPREPWKWIARQIEWNPGADEPGLALLRDARLRLHRLRQDDPLLSEVAAWRKAKQTKEM